MTYPAEGGLLTIQISGSQRGIFFIADPVILPKFFIPGSNRLQNCRIFCERDGRSIFERKVWSESKNGEREWGETLKKYNCPHPYIKFVQNYPFFQQREIPIDLILTQPVIKCQSHLIKKIQTIPFTCERFRICFEIGAKRSCGVASQMKRCFWCAANGFSKKPNISAVCFGDKQSLQLAKCFCRKPDNYRYLSAQKHYGRADNIE